MEVILAFLIGAGSTLAVQWTLRLYREGLNRAYLKKLQEDLREELGGKLEAMNNAKGCREFEDKIFTPDAITYHAQKLEDEMSRGIEKDRPQTLGELDSTLNGFDAGANLTSPVSIEKVSADDVPGDRPLTFKEVVATR